VSALHFTPERLLTAVQDCTRELSGPCRGLLVALSGGLDSTVLLTALVALRDTGQLDLPLRAMHIDHSLHADSPGWADSSLALSERLEVDYVQVRVNGRPAPGESPEAAARAARYSALLAQLRPDEALLTAHHADDQIETILLQWLRGGGLSAIAGMSTAAPFGEGWHLRPLLGFTRDSLLQWARNLGLVWREDPSNNDLRLDRNYLRHEVLPLVQRRWPGSAATVTRVAGFAREALELEAAVATADLTAVASGAALSLAGLSQLPQARQRAVIRAWLRCAGLPLPSARTLEALLLDMRRAAADRNPRVVWPGAVVHRYRGHLYAAAALAEPPAAGEWLTAETSTYALSATQSLELVADVGQGFSRTRLPRSLQVLRRPLGADFIPAGSQHRRPLRKWLQEWGVLPWARMAVPCLAHAGELVAVADLAVAASLAARHDEPSWRIVWHGRWPITEQEMLHANWSGHPRVQ
jgi:tRNA(Ile)-lysidine synthase